MALMPDTPDVVHVHSSYQTPTESKTEITFRHFILNDTVLIYLLLLMALCAHDGYPMCPVLCCACLQKTHEQCTGSISTCEAKSAEH